MKRRTADWRCSDPKAHPPDCFCRIVVVQKTSTGRAFIVREQPQTNGRLHKSRTVLSL